LNSEGDGMKFKNRILSVCASLLGILASLSPVSIASGKALPPDNSILERVARVHSELERLPKYEHEQDSDVYIQTQWVDWGNWGNWGNWGDWPNWNNWLNWNDWNNWGNWNDWRNY